MLSKQEFAKFRLEIELALKGLANKYDMDIKAGKIKYTNNSFSLVLDATRKEIDGKPYEQAEFEKWAVIYGFEPEDYGKIFNMNGKTFTLYGFNTSARTMLILARDKDGRNYKFGAEVKKLLA